MEKKRLTQQLIIIERAGIDASLFLTQLYANFPTCPFSSCGKEKSGKPGRSGQEAFRASNSQLIPQARIILSLRKGKKYR